MVAAKLTRRIFLLEPFHTIHSSTRGELVTALSLERIQPYNSVSVSMNCVSAHLGLGQTKTHEIGARHAA